jgi:hypothetical protein
MNLIHSTGIEVITDWELFRIALKKKKINIKSRIWIYIRILFFLGVYIFVA